MRRDPFDPWGLGASYGNDPRYNQYGSATTEWPTSISVIPLGPPRTVEAHMYLNGKGELRPQRTSMDSEPTLVVRRVGRQAQITTLAGEPRSEPMPVAEAIARLKGNRETL